jgi:hypothetical protein
MTNYSKNRVNKMQEIVPDGGAWFLIQNSMMRK